MSMPTAAAASRVLAIAEGRIVACGRCLDHGFLSSWDANGRRDRPCHCQAGLAFRRGEQAPAARLVSQQGETIANELLSRMLSGRRRS